LFAEGRPVRLAGGWFLLDVAHGFRIVEDNTRRGSYEVTTTSYFYSLLDRDRRELLAYHFHPEGAGWCTYPHLHVGAATGIIDNKSHLATGWVALQAVVRMLIEDPSIPVTSSRSDWALVLDAT
jgi:hypothetical protein